MGGHVTIGDYAYLGLFGYPSICVLASMPLSAVEQRLLQMLSPMVLLRGKSLHGLNLVGLRRRGFEKEALKALKKAYAGLFSSEGLFKENLAETKAELGEHDMVEKLVQFIEDGADRHLSPKIGISYGTAWYYCSTWQTLLRAGTSRRIRRPFISA